MTRASACLTFTLFAAATTLAVAADLPPGVIVRQGTAAITIEDIDAFAARMPPDQRPGYFDNAKRLESTLRQLLVERQVANDARAIGLDKESLVQREILLSTESTLSTARVAKLKEDITIPDLTELARERYQANRDTFNLPAVLDVQHILISTSKHSDEEAHAIADKVRAEAAADVDKFGALVTQYSDDPSAVDNRGVMRGAGDKTKYVPEFADAASQLSTPGQVSPVIKTKFGYHVLMLIKKEPARERGFDEVKDDLIKELSDEYVKQQVVDYMQKMQNNQLDSNAELVNSLRTRYGSAEPDHDATQPSATPEAAKAATKAKE